MWIHHLKIAEFEQCSLQHSIGWPLTFRSSWIAYYLTVYNAWRWLKMLWIFATGRSAFCIVGSKKKTLLLIADFFFFWTIGLFKIWSHFCSVFCFICYLLADSRSCKNAYFINSSEKIHTHYKSFRRILHTNLSNILLHRFQCVRRFAIVNEWVLRFW